MPVLGFLVAFYLSLLKFFYNGPDSYYTVTSIDKERHSCEENMWKTLFFINNYYNLDARVGKHLLILF